MKAAYVVQEPIQGSRYKFWKMFERVLDEVILTPKLTKRIARQVDFAIIRGDVRKEYLQAIGHGLPYLLIEHDVWSLRAGIDSDPNERSMIENAAAIIFTSQEHLDWCSRYDLPPSEVVHLRPLAKDLEFEPLPKLPGRNLVYAGGLKACDLDDPFVYRDYREIFAEFIKVGWTVHCYGAWRAFAHLRDYEALGCVIHQPVDEGAPLHREMSQYQATYQGYAEHGRQEFVHTCMPNKLWLGLASGIPTLGFNPGHGAYIYEGKWGHVAETYADLPEVSEKVLAIEIDEDLRRSEVMDNDIETFGKLVAYVAEAKKFSLTKFQLGKNVGFFEGAYYRRGDIVNAMTASRMIKEGLLDGDLSDEVIENHPNVTVETPLAAWR